MSKVSFITMNDTVSPSSSPRPPRTVFAMTAPPYQYDHRQTISHSVDKVADWLLSLTDHVFMDDIRESSISAPGTNEYAEVMSEFGIARSVGESVDEIGSNVKQMMKMVNRLATEVAKMSRNTDKRFGSIDSEMKLLREDIASISGSTDSARAKFSSKYEPVACIISSLLEHTISSVRLSYNDYAPLGRTFMTSMVSAVCNRACGVMHVDVPGVGSATMKRLHDDISPYILDSTYKKMSVSMLHGILYDEDDSLDSIIGTKVSVILKRLRVCWAVFPRWAGEALMSIDPRVMVRDGSIATVRAPRDSDEVDVGDTENIPKAKVAVKRDFCTYILSNHITDEEQVPGARLVSLLYGRYVATVQPSKGKGGATRDKRNVMSLAQEQGDGIT